MHTTHRPESARPVINTRPRRVAQRATTCLAYSLLLALSACVGIPADDDALPQQDMARAQLAAGIKLAHDGWPETQWWTRYADLQLNHLIEQALKDGPTLQVAATRIGSARAALRRDVSEKGVNVGLNATSGRTLYSADGFFPPPIGGSYYTETTIEAVAQYDFDWWGKRRATIAAALGEVNARRAEYAQAEQTLAAAVAQSYFALQGVRLRLANLQDILVIQREMLADNQKRVAHGVANVNGEHLAEFGLASLSKQAAQMDTQITREREALRALLGADNRALREIAPAPLPTPPSALPSDLGIELLARRPDLQAARWRVEAALNRIEATAAAYYPDVNLIAYFGSDVLSLNQLFDSAARTMSIGPTLTLPLFDSGRLKAALDAARSLRNETIADYNLSVLNAVREVAQDGAALQGLQRQMVQQSSEEEAVADLYLTTQARFNYGLTGRITLLTAKLAVREEQDAGLQLKSQLLQSDVALIKALGGGYRAANRQTSPVEPSGALEQ